MSEATIGTIDWSGCDDCSHASDTEDGCDVPQYKWEPRLRVAYESVYCGSYERREKVPDAI